MLTVVRLELEHVCAHAAITFTKTTGAVMDCQAIERYQPMSRKRSEGWRSVLARLLCGFQPRYPRLDLEVMSEYMKRDLGFMDGRDPREDSDMTR
ncbi:hypothetical protein ASE23_08860 [Rhizobium sp. Root73]|nr:hypothetical protein ASC96_10625 [Rhizobium sp. Root1204]KQY04997.1 hypothetical protein ASD36_11075 [Rhizobium sp. Root1334]KRC01639.1 hypothetical protein ASE23_08860 [Rhizobium sp. Root73]